MFQFNTRGAPHEYFFAIPLSISFQCEGRSEWRSSAKAGIHSLSMYHPRLLSGVSHIVPRIPLFPWLQFVDDATLVRENSGVAVSTAEAERKEEDDAEQAET